MAPNAIIIRNLLVLFNINPNPTGIKPILFNIAAKADDELILICGSKHPFKEKTSINLHELSKADLILRESGSGTRELFENIMLSKGFSLNIKWVCNNSKAIKNAVISNIGVSIVSRMAVENELENNKLFHIKLDDIKLKRKFNIIYHGNKYITKPMENFWNLCYTL
ncbi:LysR substrate-binding domain-containing protein [Schnuerera ultunensis]